MMVMKTEVVSLIQKVGLLECYWVHLETLCLQMLAEVQAPSGVTITG